MNISEPGSFINNLMQGAAPEGADLVYQATLRNFGTNTFALRP